MTFWAVLANQAKDDAIATTQERSNDLAVLQDEYARLQIENERLVDENAGLKTQAGGGPGSTAAEAEEPPIVDISAALIEIEPMTDRMVGPSTYSSDGTDLAFRARYAVQDAGGEVRECTITSFITNVSTQETYPLRDTQCDSVVTPSIVQSLGIGNYRLDAEAYVPATQARSSASFTFAVT